MSSHPGFPYTVNKGTEGLLAEKKIIIFDSLHYDSSFPRLFIQDFVASVKHFSSQNK